MRRFLILLFLLCLAPPALAQKPVTVYFPLVLKDAGVMATCDNHWKIVVPVATTNYVLNPSAEGTTGYAAAGGAIVSRVTTYAKYGLHSYRVIAAAHGDGLSLNLLASGLTNVDHYLTFRARGDLPSDLVVAVGPNYRAPLLLETIDSNWSVYGTIVPAAEANGSTTLHILQRGPGSGIFYLDGIQLEPHAYPTTYVDGAQPGCGWNGAQHASTSTRSALSRAGGRVRDLADDYAFYVTEHSGTGMGPQRLSVDDYALLPGGELNAVKSQSRVWTLTGDFVADSEEDLHAKRQALLLALDPNAYDAQPVLVRYTGADVEKEIAAVYEAGLEISGLPAYYGPYRRNATGSEWQQDYVFSERAAIRFLSPDPHWYEIGESAVELDVNDSGTFRGVAGRLKSTGQWDNLGPPGAFGTYNAVYAIAEDENYVYFGGNFTDFDDSTGLGNTNDNIVRYNKLDGTYSTLGVANNIVYALALAPDGNLYATGDFTTIGGVAANRIARWDGANWFALGGGLSAGGRCLAVGHSGEIFVGGNFATAGGVAVNYIAAWSGGAWSALGAGMNTFVFAVAVGPSGILYAGGSFVTAGGGAANYIAQWDGSSWSALGSGMDNDVLSLAVYQDGTLYAGGDFTTAGGGAANYVARWNGTAWFALGDGTNGRVDSLAVGPDGLLLAGGSFTSAGGITFSNRLALWNGSSWAHVDISDLPIVYEIYPSKFADPVKSSIYDIFVGYEITTTAYYGGLVTATNLGTTESRPIVTFERTGGSDPAVLEWLRNETTGETLWMNYRILDGETLELDLRPTRQKITSSFFGPVPRAVLAPSELSQFVLGPGDNNITAYVNFDVGLYPTEINAWLTWRTSYLSLD